VERSRVIDGSSVRAGDAIIGMASSGLHANGYSLVRALVAQWDLDLAEPYQARLRRTLGDAVTDGALARAERESMATLGEVLLTPTVIYARAILAVRETLAGRGWDVRGLAHITGGGLPANVPRALPAGLAALLDPTRWLLPSVMRLIGALSGMDDQELRATFNGGLGMIAVVPAAAVTATIAALGEHGLQGMLVGEVVSADAVRGARYLEGALGGAVGGSGEVAM
jgi:phosphoribosylformylglycinamidine cyclo-ligase